VTESDPKADLRRYLQAAREALVWKLEGLSEYDIRRPMVPTGTNLLGLVKHVASVEAGYFGETFGRPFPVPLPWLDEGAEPNADMWATAEESRDQLVGLYHRVWAHSDATIDALALDAVGQVPWWPREPWCLRVSWPLASWRPPVSWLPLLQPPAWSRRSCCRCRTLRR